MTRQVITVRADGSLQGLQHKPGKGLDLRQFGTARIERASEVLWHEESQSWVVEFRSGVLKGETLDQGHLMAAGIDGDQPPFKVKGIAWTAFERSVGEGDQGVLLFEDYDQGVAAEIAVLDGLRLNGIY